MQKKLDGMGITADIVLDDNGRLSGLESEILLRDERGCCKAILFSRPL